MADSFLQKSLLEILDSKMLIGFYNPRIFLHSSSVFLRNSENLDCIAALPFLQSKQFGF